MGEDDVRGIISALPRQIHLDQARPIRLPLVFWSAEILAHLETLRVAKSVSYPDIVACINLAALLEVFRGNIDGATDLCMEELRWIARIVEKGGEEHVRYLAIRPWINLGRLSRLRGTPDTALPYFTLLHSYETRDATVLGPCRITPETWEEMEANYPDLRRLLTTVYVTDTLKTLLAVDAHEAALAFVDCLPTSVLEIDVVAHEGRLIALERLGRLEDALEFSAQCVSLYGTYAQLVFQLHQIGILLTGGLVHEARNLGTLLADLLLTIHIHDSAVEPSLRLFALAGNLLEALQEESYATAIYQRGCDIARRVQDEPFLVRFLSALVRILLAVERKPYEDELRDTLASTYYVECKGQRSTEPSSPTHTEIFTALMQRIRQVLEDD